MGRSANSPGQAPGTKLALLRRAERLGSSSVAVPVWTTVTLGPHSALDPRVSPERVDVDEAGGINGLVVSLYVHAAKREEAVSTPRPGLVIQATGPLRPLQYPQNHLRFTQQRLSGFQHQEAP